MWGDRAEVIYGMHHWPAWGRERVLEMLTMGRDGYRFIHDETLRLANHGLAPAEIAERVAFPPRLGRHWALRGYYGSLNHNVKATYVNALGWFDGNPANLWTHPPERAAARYVEFMGGAEAVLAKAREAFAAGDYRWVVEVVNHVIFADPDDEEAKALQADAFEQLGYQSESGSWRNFFLTGASELRNGVLDLPAPNTGAADSVRAMSAPLFFDYLGMRLNGQRAGDRRITIGCVFGDVGESWTLILRNGALSHRVGVDPGADATVTLDRADLNAVILGTAPLLDQIADGRASVDGDERALHDLIDLLDEFEFWFNIVTP